eukprot:m.177209 g.177209  ORF g.177209 m.177209 type:complete len:73 (+) comp15453_c0_seq7:4396-4614(+)
MVHVPKIFQYLKTIVKHGEGLQTEAELGRRNCQPCDRNCESKGSLHGWFITWGERALFEQNKCLDAVVEKEN